MHAAATYHSKKCLVAAQQNINDCFNISVYEKKVSKHAGSLSPEDSE